jgi:hypothetical protein
MRPPLPADTSRKLPARVLRVLWPAFVMAGVLEMLVFAAVDPDSLHGPGAYLLAGSRPTVYSVTFFVFWAVIAASAAVTQWLDSPGEP